MKLERKDYIIIGLVLTIIICLVYFLFFNKKSFGQDNKNSLTIEEGGTFDHKNDLDLTKDISIPVWNQLKIPAGKKEVVIELNNPIENEGSYYLSFELFLPESEESLYQSDLVKPGEYVKDVKLKRALDAGEYDAKESGQKNCPLIF